MRGRSTGRSLLGISSSEFFLAISLTLGCAERVQDQSPSVSSGGSSETTALQPNGTGGSTVATTLPEVVAPSECSLYDGDILVTTQETSRFVVVGGVLYVHFPIDQGGIVQTDVDEIRLQPYARRVVSSTPYYGDTLTASGGLIYWNQRPHSVIYLDDDPATYHVNRYDPATKQTSQFAMAGARVPVRAPTGLLVIDSNGGMSFYAPDGSSQIALCSSVSASTAAANSSVALAVSFRDASLCNLATGVGSSWVPYAGWDGFDIRALEMDERYAYLLQADITGSATDGVYRLDLASRELTRIVTGRYSHLRLFGSELWLADADGRILRATEASNFAPTVVTTQAYIRQLEVDDQYVYWHQMTSSQIGCIKRLAKPL